MRSSPVSNSGNGRRLRFGWRSVNDTPALPLAVWGSVPCGRRCVHFRLSANGNRVRPWVATASKEPHLADPQDGALRHAPLPVDPWLLQPRRIGRATQSLRYPPRGGCRLPRISRATLLALCALRERPAVRGADPRGLAAFLVGCHHQITHEALVGWLGRNQNYEREGG